mgnify:FL=1
MNQGGTNLHAFYWVVQEPTRVTRDEQYLTKYLLLIVKLLRTSRFWNDDISDYSAIQFDIRADARKSAGYYKTRKCFRNFDANENFKHAKFMDFHLT